jgi:hypothetical protein
MRSASPRASGSFRLEYLRLVLQTLLVGTRRLHVAEGIDHLGGRIDFLQPHLIDAHAGPVDVEYTLHQLVYGLLGFLACTRQEWLDIGLADHLAHGTLSHVLHGDVGVVNIEQIQLRILDAPEDHEIDVDNVFISRQHQAFVRHCERPAIDPA